MKKQSEDPYIELFAKRLYELRETTGQSARDMSLSLGQSHNYINCIESQKNYPAMQMFFYICDYLKISPREFFEFDNTAPQIANELYNEIKKLDKKTQEHLLFIIKNLCIH